MAPPSRALPELHACRNEKPLQIHRQDAVQSPALISGTGLETSIPALFTRMSIAPNVLTVCATAP